MRRISIAVLALSSLILGSCSIDWNDEKDVRISELEKQVSNIQNANTPLKITPDTSFKTHIVQVGWIHSKIYDWSYWQISSLDEPYPQTDSSVRDIDELNLKIKYDWRKAYFNISCPEWFQITDCHINNSNINADSNSCHFAFSDEMSTSDIYFICNNGKLITPL